ncbi:hypothetical protein BJV82DRAFT_232642 [Fennellomyces sp. T-0311]|nr:hypothetical protein BJV82DRAFT_232642 [Fennellomyces sp. T-0311]
MKRGLFRSTSRMLLRTAKKQDELAVEAALAKAKLAVLHDSAGNAEEAIDAYAETVALLSKVKDDALVKIRDTYAQRITVLEQEIPSVCTEEWSDGPPTPVSINDDPWRHSPSPSTTSEEPVFQTSPSLFFASTPIHESVGATSSYYWALLKRLKQSMVQGGYLTDRLYVPKQLWYQPNQDIPDLDNKLALTEHLLSIVKSLRQRSDPMRIMNELQTLEEALIKSTSVTATPTATHTTKKWRASLGRHIQSSWKNNKLVERIRQDPQVPRMMDDRYHMYIRTLIKLFSAAQVLGKVTSMHGKSTRA